MSSFDFNLEAIGALAFEEFRSLSEDVLDQVTGEQLPRVQKAVMDLMAENMKALANPTVAFVHRRNAEIILATLENEALLAQIQATKHARRAVANVVLRITGMVLGSLT